MIASRSPAVDKISGDLDRESAWVDKVFGTVDKESEGVDKIDAGSKPDQTGEGTRMRQWIAVFAKT